MIDFAELFERAPIPLQLVAPDGTILHANQAQLELLGYERATYLGRRVHELADPATVAALLRRLAAGERVQGYPLRMVAKDGLVRNVLIDASGRLGGDGPGQYTTWFARDVTHEVVAKRLTEESQTRFALLSDASSVLVGVLDEDEVLQRLARFLVPRLADWAAVHVLDDDAVRLAAIAHVDPAKEAFGRDWLARRPLSPTARFGVPAVIRTGEPLLRSRISSEVLHRLARTPEEQAALKALGIASIIVVPLAARGQTFGAVTAMMAESGRTYGPSDLTILDELARRAALAADNARLYQRAEASRAEAAAAAEGTSRLAAIVRDSTDAIISKTLDGTITSWNEAAERMYGYAAHEVIGKPITIVVPPDKHDEENQILARLRRGEHLEHYETVRMRKDGSRLDVSLTVSAVRNARGEIVGASKIARDISARKRAEAERQELLRREQAARAEADAARRHAEFLADTAATLSSSLDYEATLGRVTRLMVPHLGDLAAIDMLGEDGSIHRLATAHVDPAQEAWLREARRRYGYSPEGPIARTIQAGTSRLMADVRDEHLVRMASSPEQLEGFRRLAIVSGMFVPLKTRGQTLGVMSVLATARSGRRYTRDDLTRLEDVAQRAAAAIDNARLYRAAEQARAAAEAANRAKDQFLATVSHELRTPLNSILGWARMIESGDLEPAMVGRAARIIVQSASSQAQLIDDLLDLSRIVTGRMRLEVRPCELARIVAEAIDVVRPSAEAKGVALSGPAAASGAILGDPERLKQVIWNLLVNAIKFTPRGGHVRISVRETPRGHELVVADDGEGIAPDVLPHVFEQFRQEDGSTTRAHGGLGLGLALVKHLIELHGGWVTAESPGKGRGSTFTVVLPPAALASVALDAPAHGGE